MSDNGCHSERSEESHLFVQDGSGSKTKNSFKETEIGLIMEDWEVLRFKSDK